MFDFRVKFVIQPHMEPDFFNEAKLTVLNWHAVAHWDETHKKVIIGGKGHGTKGARTQVRYRRNCDVQPDPEGDLRLRSTQMKCKYTAESRFGFDCAIIMANGNEIGVICKPFDYSGMQIVTIADYKQHQLDEMERVKKLPSLSAPWVVGKRRAHGLFMLDSVAEIKGVGPTAAKKLIAAGIGTVAELVAKDPTTHVDGISTTTLATFVARGKTARQGGFPKDMIINHKQAANPYKSLHGDQWQVVIATTTAMQKYACITELVEHMVHASAAVFKGTGHEWTWMMVHDALSLMTSKECRAWMGGMQLKGPTPAEDRTFLDCWVLPEQGLNAGTVYANRPPGNCSELMCWDASLNNDVDDAVARHVAATSHLAVGHDLRFSRATPVLQTKAFLRVLVGSPTSERIVQDVKRVLPPLLTIQLKRGRDSSCCWPSCC
jgi:hypothetical protein